MLPTGRNFYGVDPRNLPTAAAWEIGKNLGNQVIERYIAEEGRYPKALALSCGREVICAAMDNV